MKNGGKLTDPNVDRALDEFLSQDLEEPEIPESEFKDKYLLALHHWFFGNLQGTEGDNKNAVYSAWCKQVVINPRKGCHLTSNGERVAYVPPMASDFAIENLESIDFVNFVNGYKSLMENNDKSVIGFVKKFNSTIVDNMDVEDSNFFKWLKLFARYELMDQRVFEIIATEYEKRTGQTINDQSTEESADESDQQVGGYQSVLL
jgi:hypothetical protein